MIDSLATEVVHRIAAGEVIDSLAAVVRELAENAIDAKANRIAIAINSSANVRVSDNGWGMSLTDLKQAALPHSTSKIKHLSDLEAIASLGFRGEALFSLAQLANLRIASRSDDLGWQIAYNQAGCPLSQKQVAIASGTIVEVENLFADLYSRSQSLPSFSQQLRQVQNLIYDLAIAQPQISWQVELNSQQHLSIYGGEVKDILLQILPRIQPTDLVSGGEGEVQITIGLSDRCSRHRADWVKLIVNGRVVNVAEIEQTICSAFAQTLPRHRFPVCVVTMQIAAGQIDWNRLPTKREIYLQNLPEWQKKIADLISQLQRLPSVCGSPPDLNSGINPILKYSPVQHSPRLAENNSNYATKGYNSDLPDSQLNSQVSSQLKAIAQVQQTYILAEHQSGIWLIEQHVAHERILFEQIEQQWQILAIDPPLLLENLTEEKSIRLASLGIEIEPFGAETWMVRSLPQILIDQIERHQLAETLHELAQTDHLPTAKASAACRSAIRNGTALDLIRMQQLLDQWQQCRNPRTCPHGRPICLSLDSDRLARFFRRNWLIKN